MTLNTQVVPASFTGQDMQTESWPAGHRVRMFISLSQNNDLLDTVSDLRCTQRFLLQAAV